MSDLPAQMRAVEITGFGPAEMLQPVIRPMIKPARGELLIRVAAAGVNRPDVVQREGHYAPPPGASDLPGLEVAGIVAAVGEAAEGYQIGDRVCALLAGGGYAEFACAPAEQCLPMPRGLSSIEAASLPETCFTVWDNVFVRGRFQPGETVLIHGGSSGIGVMAIQMVRAFGGHPIATVGSADKQAACLALGAELAINYHTTDFVQAVENATSGKGADLILDMVGGDYLPRNMKAAAVEGRLVSIAALQGSKSSIDIFRMMHKRLTIMGSTLRSRPIAAKAAIALQLRAKVWPLIEAGVIKPVIFRTFPLAQAALAHRLMESSSHIGKIMLEVAALDQQATSSLP